MSRFAGGICIFCKLYALLLEFVYWPRSAISVSRALSNIALFWQSFSNSHNIVAVFRITLHTTKQSRMHLSQLANISINSWLNLCSLGPYSASFLIIFVWNSAWKNCSELEVGGIGLKLFLASSLTLFNRFCGREFSPYSDYLSNSFYFFKIFIKHQVPLIFIGTLEQFIAHIMERNGWSYIYYKTRVFLFVL